MIIALLELYLIFINITFSGAITLQLIRRHRNTFKKNWKILKKLEVVPITNHYYEPLISKRQLSAPCGIRDLKEINFNIKEQLEVLKGFDYADELKKIPMEKTAGGVKSDMNIFTIINPMVQAIVSICIL